MALLRASSTALGIEIDLGPALDRGLGVADGDVLLAFADAAHGNTSDLVRARSALVAAVGDGGLLDAAQTVAVFNGLTRVADATGIALDGGTLAATTDARAALGLNAMPGALNTAALLDDSAAPVLPASVRDLFAG